MLEYIYEHSTHLTGRKQSLSILHVELQPEYLGILEALLGILVSSIDSVQLLYKGLLFFRTEFDSLMIHSG